MENDGKNIINQASKGKPWLKRILFFLCLPVFIAVSSVALGCAIFVVRDRSGTDDVVRSGEIRKAVVFGEETATAAIQPDPDGSDGSAAAAGDKAEAGSKTTAKKQEKGAGDKARSAKQAKALKADVSALPKGLREAGRTILEGAEKTRKASVFFGGHPADAAFLAWYAENFGEKGLLAIAKAGVFDDPQIWFEASGKSMQVLWHLYQKEANPQYEAERVQEIDAASTKETVFAFTGDVNLAEGISGTKYIDGQPNGLSDAFSQDLIHTLRDEDVLIANNEFTVSKRGKPLSGKAYTFRANPGRLKEYRRLGVDALSLANNHVFDYGEEAFLDTLHYISNAGYPYVGAGKNLEEASEPLYYIAGGRKIAICAATQIERSSTYTRAATEQEAGVIKCLDPELFAKEIKRAKKNADVVIAFVHWGTEGDSQYGSDQKNLAKQFAAAGADAIVGGHTHCLQGVDLLEGVPVFYSLGNFWFSGTSKVQEDYDTALCEIHVARDGSVSGRLLPCSFSGYVTKLSSGKEKARIIKEINQVSGNANLDADGVIEGGKH